MALLASPALPDDGPLPGRNVVAVVGIDRYRHWPILGNAVSDAKGALEAFRGLGFEELTHHLFDGEATCAAIQNLVVDELRCLRPEDSLVLFLSGHGHTHTAHLSGGGKVETGYFLPVDAGDAGQPRLSTMLRLDTLLEQVAQLPARHLLVIIDACHSGIALSLTKWRDFHVPSNDPGLHQVLATRRSRRAITSALSNQPALDSGPVPGHSLFTGALLNALGADRPGTTPTCPRQPPTPAVRRRRRAESFGAEAGTTVTPSASAARRATTTSPGFATTTSASAAPGTSEPRSARQGAARRG